MLDPIVATLIISNSYLSDILNGRRMPTMWMLRPMLEYFDLELETVNK